MSPFGLPVNLSAGTAGVPACLLIFEVPCGKDGQAGTPAVPAANLTVVRSASMFETEPIPEARPIAILKKVFVMLVVALLAIGAVSSYRADVQVRSVELNANRELATNSNIGVSVVTSGRTQVDVQVELLQGSRSQKLFTFHVPGNELGFFDPRPQHASRSTVLTKDQLAGFEPGAATLRATAIGRHQWMWLPPPTKSEVGVEIRLE